MPVSINLTKYGFRERAAGYIRSPGRYKIYGSNDGTSWVELFHRNGAKPTYASKEFNESITTSGKYNHFALFYTHDLHELSIFDFNRNSAELCMSSKIVMIIQIFRCIRACAPLLA